MLQHLATLSIAEAVKDGSYAPGTLVPVGISSLDVTDIKFMDRDARGFFVPQSKRQWKYLSTRTADWNDGSFRDPAVRLRWLKDARCSLVTRLWLRRQPGARLQQEVPTLVRLDLVSAGCERWEGGASSLCRDFYCSAPSVLLERVRSRPLSGSGLASRAAS